jgi:hypothetical protein
MDKRYAAGVAAGLASAVLAISAVTGSVLALVLTFASPLPLFIAGLGWGVKAVAVAMGTGTFGFFLLTSPVGAIFYATTLGIPALAICHLALLARRSDPNDTQGSQTEWYPAERLTVWIAVMAAGLVVLPHLALLGQGGLPGIVTATILPLLLAEASTLAANLTASGMPITAEELSTSWQQTLPMALPVFLATFWFLMMGANTIFAQKIVRLSKKAIRGDFGVARMQLPKTLVTVLAAALLLSFWGGSLGFTGSAIASVVAIPFFVLGLVTIHVVTGRWIKRAGDPGPLTVMRTMGLTMFYFLLTVPGMALAVVVLGLTDQWMGLRQSAFAHAAKEESK